MTYTVLPCFLSKPRPRMPCMILRWSYRTLTFSFSFEMCRRFTFDFKNHIITNCPLFFLKKRKHPVLELPGTSKYGEGAFFVPEALGTVAAFGTCHSPTWFCLQNPWAETFLWSSRKMAPPAFLCTVMWTTPQISISVLTGKCRFASNAALERKK